MEKRWLLSLFCLLSVPGAAGQSDDVITQTEVVHALPGTDATLVCIFPKPHTTYIIQTQWSKTDDNQLARIAVYHPIYGTHYFTFPEASYNFSVSFSVKNCCDEDSTEASCSTDANTVSECSWWALHLKNVTSSLNGQYECSFATYPHGTKAAKMQLIVRAEEEQHYVKEVWLNQTLEIPCLEDMTSDNLSNYPLKWLVGENGRKEELVTKEPSGPAVYRNGSTLYGERVRLTFNNTLKIFPTEITDDGRAFSCHVMYHPERVRKSSTTVRVFGNNSNEASSENFTTMGSEDLGNSAFPSAVMTTSKRWSTSLASLDFTSQASLAPASTTQAGKQISNPETKSYTSASALNDSLTTAHLNDFTTESPQTLGNTTRSFENTTLIHRGTSNTKASYFPWPTVVAILLLLCSFLMALGIRKWCQYQKEIMDRPPSFKPPPPPIKYTSMMESDGTTPSCHELENL